MPPVVSLRAFDAAARHRGYSAAGRELNVSHAAIAQQVRSLEKFLGLKLAERAGRGIALTPAGMALADGLSQGFEKIAETVLALTTAEAERPLHITMTPMFAVNWFMPRLHQFRDAHPDIELSINPTPTNIDLLADHFDAAIRYGAGDWEGVVAAPLVASNFAIVGAPKLIKNRRVDRPRDLLDLHWLQELGTNEIAHWLESHEISLPKPSKITELPGYMMLNALREGQGIGATARMFVEDDILAGHLVVLFEETDGAPKMYHLLTRPSIQRPPLKKFVRWIKRVAASQ